MNHSKLSKLLAAVLLASSALSLTALAAPVGTDSTTAIRADRGSSTTSTIKAVSDSKSPVKVDPDQAKGKIDVVYQDKNGKETSADVAVVNPNAPRYACINAGGDSLRVRQGPGTSYSILASVYDGNCFPITGIVNGWYQITVNGRTGYVSAEFVIEKTEEETIPPIHDNTLAGQIVAYALQFEGYPYVYGTAGPNTFDCSGFTSYVYKHFGYTLNRSSKDQLKNGTPITKAELQPADLLLFSRDGDVVTHVGLYIGDGQFIHASTATTGVIISDLNSNYYVNHYYAARRII